MKKDYCTFFPEYWIKVSFLFKVTRVYIGDCCKKHDNDCSTRKFFLCLKGKIGEVFASIIGFFGSTGCWWKFKKYMASKTEDSVLPKDMV